MTKWIKYFGLAALAAFIGVSCQQELEEEVSEPQTQETPHLTTITCEFPMMEDENGTKVSLASDGTTGWQVGDEIVIYGKRRNGVAHPTEDRNYLPEDDRIIHALTAGEITDPTRAVFSVDLSGLEADPAGVHPFNAAYPAASWDFYSEWYASGRARFYETNKPLMAGYLTNEGQLALFNLCSAITFQVSGDYDSYYFSGYNGTETVGYEQFLCELNNSETFYEGSDAEKYMKASKLGSSNGTKSPLTSITGSVNGNGEALNYIFIPYQANLPNGFAIVFAKNGKKVKQIKSKAALTLQHGHMINLGLLPDSKIKDYHELSASQMASATNLSETESANCYVVVKSDANAGKVYKFDAVKGNTATSVGTVDAIEVLWETWNTSDTVTPNSLIAKTDYKDGVVYFQTAASDVFHAGNAVIAAKDSEGTILWSWHIWVPSTDYTTDTYMLYDHELMDRYLGALDKATTSSVPVETFGLLYQWGRKDPFVGAAATSGSSNAMVSGTALSLSAGTLTLDQSIQNPTVLGSGTDWLSATNNDLWKNDEKTQYDPCPAGYKVPGYDSVQPLCSSDYSGVTGWSDNAESRYFTLGDPATVFPYAGYREENNTDMYKVGQRAAVWTSYSNSTSGYAYHMNVRNASTHAAGNTAKSRGCSIRCAKIVKAPIFNASERASATDKSATASANCYEVSAGDENNASKIFKFRAVKGNSSTSVGTVATASVIWETWNNNDAVTAHSVIDEVDYYDGYVYFKMPATLHAGNALIAVKNSAGTILWSWHIWVPATSVAPIDNGIHTTPMMDRNLGALNVAVASADAKIDVTSVGMWYQWGRKDPFPGPNNITTEGTYAGFASVSGTAPSAQKVQLSLDESIQQPTLFARGLYVEDALTVSDWNSTADGTLWGDNTTKSIYDPCPVGYRVPNRDKNKPLWKADMTNETGWSYNATNYWFTLGNPASVFPCAGYNDGGSAKITFRTVLWNAHHDSSSNADTAYNIYVYLSSGTPKFANYGHGKSRGYFVRCCQE